jgi:hypothetical protein
MTNLSLPDNQENQTWTSTFYDAQLADYGTVHFSNAPFTPSRWNSDWFNTWDWED